MPNSGVDDPDGDEPGDRTRRRISKACDRCRKARSKCEPSGSSQDCKSCIELEAECTFVGPTQKRGPPKGYTEDATRYLKRLEALVSAFVVSKHPVLQDVLAQISQDSIAGEIIDKVRGGPSTDQYPAHSSSAQNQKKKAKKPPSDVFATPDDRGQTASGWQNRIEELILSQLDAPENSLRGSSVEINEPTPYPPYPDEDPQELSGPSNYSRYPVSESRGETTYRTGNEDAVPAEIGPYHNHFVDADDLSVAIGQLSIDDEDYLCYHGRSSGLHLLASVVAQVDRRKTVRSAPRPTPSRANNLMGTLPIGSNFAPPLSSADHITGLPSWEMQEYLLRLYFVYVHPHFPIVHVGDVMRSFRHSQRHQLSTSAGSPKPIPQMLLFAMYAVATRCEDKTIPPAHLSPGVDDLSLAYFEEAMRALSEEKGLNKFTTCQVLLLLTYYEVGAGNMNQAWHLMGTAVRTAQEIGLHRSVEKWPNEIAGHFLLSEKQTFRRIWYMCVILDKQLSVYVGRPTAIREQDYDTESPDLDIEEDAELTQLALALEPHNPNVHFSAAIDCLRERVALSTLFGSISLKVYSIRPWPASVDRCGELTTMAITLQKWKKALPDHLNYDAESNSNAPPAVMCMHMYYWLIYILLCRPFIRLLDDSELEHLDEASIVQNKKSAEIAYGACNRAAISIAAIAASFAENHGPEKFPAFIPYYVFSASIMHVTVLLDKSDDAQASAGLTKCMDLLKRMEVIWPNAGRSWDLLYGWKVHLSNAELQHIDRESRFSKRPADEELHFSRPAPAPPGDSGIRNPMQTRNLITEFDAPPARHDAYQQASSSRSTLTHFNAISPPLGYDNSWSEEPLMFGDQQAPQNHPIPPYITQFAQPHQHPGHGYVTSDFDSGWVGMAGSPDHSAMPPHVYGVTNPFDDGTNTSPHTHINPHNLHPQNNATGQSFPYDSGDGGHQWT